jgi:DNA-binding transcriptional LysR family regulator
MSSFARLAQPAATDLRFLLLMSLIAQIINLGNMSAWDDLHAAVTLADELHFGRAAQRLHVAQPSLTRQIRRLEARVGALLFERTTRRVSLTEAGEAYVGAARGALARAAAAEEDARAVARGERGRLRLAYPGSAVNRVVPGALVRFGATDPAVRLDLTELFDDDALTAAVVDGTVDASFTRLPARSAGLVVHDLGREPLAAVLPGDHPLAAAGEADATELEVGALAGERLLLWPRAVSPASYDELAGVFATAGVPLQVTQEVPTVQTMLALVAAGLGVGVLAESYSVQRRRGVVFRRLAGAGSRLHLIHRPDRRSALLDRFVDACLTVGTGGSR